MKRILEINKDPNLTDAEKAAARQDLMTGKWKEKIAASSEDADAAKGALRLALPPSRSRPTARSCRRFHRSSAKLLTRDAPAADDKGKAAAKENNDNDLLDDDTLKCAICFDLCVRPVTVRPAAGSAACCRGLCGSGTYIAVTPL